MTPAAPARRAALLPAFGLGAIVVSFMQALVVPAIDDIADRLDVSPTAAGWAVTANLLACAVLTPLLGRVGDLHGKRRVMLGALAACLAGSLLAALTSSLWLLLVARVLQGASGGVFPLAVGILREELPAGRVTRSTAIVSGMLSFGAGLGLVLTGVLTGGHADYHRIFWLAAAVSAAAMAAVAWAVPRRPRHLAGRVDFTGALLLGAGLLPLLLGLSQASRWGVGTVGGCVALAAAVLALWLRGARRAEAPLIDPTLLARRPVLITNVAGLFVGLANFGCVLGVTRLAQAPAADGGFAASVLTTSLAFLLPATLCSALAAPAGGELVHRAGGRRAMLLAGTLGTAGFLGLAFAHGERGLVITWAILVLCSVSVAYAAMPALLAAEVEPAHTAVANSINSVARWVGGAVASALVVSLLASDRAPSEAAFAVVFSIGAAGCLASTALVARWLPRAAVA